MEKYEYHEIVIVGGGICGLATALALHRKGIKSIVLERSESVRATGAAMIMLPNGWRALDHLGVADTLRKTSTVTIERGYRITMPDGRRSILPLGDDEIRSIKRFDLVKTMLDNLPAGTVYFASRAVSLKMDAKSSRSIIHLDDGRLLSAKLVIGCDGVNSMVASALGLNSMKFLNTTAIRGLTLYPNGHGFRREFLIYSPDKGQFGYIPITEVTVSWFVSRIEEPQDSSIVADKLRIKEAALDFIKGFDERAIEMVKSTDMENLHLQTSLVYRNPFDLITTSKSFRKGTVTVAGDALHAMGPFIAQGGGLSLEDAVVLARCVAPCISTGPSGTHVEKSIEAALDKYFGQRKMRAFWLMCQAFLVGITAGTHPSKLFKLVSIILLIVLYRDPSAHTRFDCRAL